MLPRHFDMFVSVTIEEMCFISLLVRNGGVDNLNFIVKALKIYHFRKRDKTCFTLHHKVKLVCVIVIGIPNLHFLKKSKKGGLVYREEKQIKHSKS